MASWPEPRKYLESGIRFRRSTHVLIKLVLVFLGRLRPSRCERVLDLPFFGKLLQKIELQPNGETLHTYRNLRLLRHCERVYPPRGSKSRQRPPATEVGDKLDLSRDDPGHDRRNNFVGLVDGLDIFGAILELIRLGAGDAL